MLFRSSHTAAFSQQLEIPAAIDGVAKQTCPHQLIVADDQRWQEQCRDAMAVLGPAIDVRFAETGYLALLQIGQKSPDVLITNLELPGLDGIAMLRTLERCESIAALRVLVITDLTDSELMRKGGLPSCAEVVRSPVSAESMALRVGRFLVGQRATV